MWRNVNSNTMWTATQCEQQNNVNSNTRTKQTLIFLCYLHMSQIKTSFSKCHRSVASTLHTCCSRPFLALHCLPKMNRCENSFCVVFDFGKAFVIIRVSSSRVILFSLPRNLLVRGLPCVDNARRSPGMLPLLACVLVWVFLPVCTELWLFSTLICVFYWAPSLFCVDTSG
jgi:hypothetical protein